MEAPAYTLEDRLEHVPGRGVLALEHGTRGTFVRAARANSPLKFLLPRNHGRGAWAYLASFGGGLVDGDSLHIDVSVGARATGLLSTQSATKVYRSPRGCRQLLQAQVGEEGLLVLLPDPVACFTGARYEQETSVTLAPSASLVLLDAFTCGRAARGERWAFAHYLSRLLVQRGGVPLLLDAVRLTPEEGALAPRMGRFEALALLAVFGPQVAALREALLTSPAPLRRRASVIETASPLGEDGALLRVAATSVEEALSAVRSRLRTLPSLLGDDPLARKW
ncbi:urease accessory protein UreD [Hyalangium minutum]|uniref:Urease accessory protein UreD n=1 Tax=Hyalangium minutum TaxID=394096 RepID=A0A085WTY7_9BACT|nr:urease accessory protein UreD [Hyalangium minutum]KFE71150.1 Urease accessory protein UreD [Hyalangium minutum]